MTDVWNPAQYERFKAEREQPFIDVLALIHPKPDMRVVDLGCGTGALTSQLHQRLKARETVGIDSSSAMLERAQAHAGGGLSFALGDIATWQSAGWDLVFSNAALHWVSDHPSLFRALKNALKPGGQVAIQMPANFDHPSHLTAAAVAREAPFAEALGGWELQPSVLPVERYADLLHALGFSSQHVRLQVYGHVLPSTEDVVEWVKGTLLTEYQRRLPPPLFEQFVSRYKERLLGTLGSARPFFFTFKRVLLWGALPE